MTIRKPLILTCLAGIGLLAGANAAFAATSATQNVSFSVAKAVAITSGGDVTIGSITPPSTGSGSGTVTVSSNDSSGFQLNASTSGATVTESGGSCTPNAGNTFSVSNMTIGAGSASGGVSGSGGTAKAAFAMPTTATDLYSTDPTMMGQSISVSLSYVASPGYSTPANSTNCSYTVPVTLAVVAK